MTTRIFSRRLLSALVLSALIAWTIAIFEPIKSTVQNWEELTHGFGPLLRYLITPFSVIFGTLALLSLPMARLAPDRWLAILVALQVGLWAQGNLFLWNYGSFDGTAIDWAEHQSKGVLEAAAWLLVFTLALLRSRVVASHALRIAALTTALQLASLTGHMLDNWPLSKKPDHVEATPGRAASFSLYSNDSNILVIILDSFQSDFFSEAMIDESLTAAMPPGFTFYRNATSLYPTTQFSLQSILTSQAVPSGENSVNWRRLAMKESLPSVLANEGFDVTLTSFTPWLLACATSGHRYRCFGSSPLAAPNPDANVRLDTTKMFNAGLFRLAPHFLKFGIYDGGDWRVPPLYPVQTEIDDDPRIDIKMRLDLSIFDTLTRLASVADVAPRFRMLHLFAAHAPPMVDESCSFDLRFDREGYIATSRCVLSRLFEFLTRLDELGIYDRSLIFVVGDHGSSLVPVAPDSASSWPPPTKSSKSAGESITPNFNVGVPLFLAKGLDERHPLRVSDLPVSLCDIPSSIADTLNLKKKFECQSIFSIEEGESRTRSHYRHIGIFEQRKKPRRERMYFDFDEYSIQGHSWFAEAWKPDD
ncbi:sulfatase-like hydrolase/transferase [Myxococcota bacterium]|nr:sulfatase-like hydrolase/transferase [Myxococcota bacterium]